MTQYREVVLSDGGRGSDSSARAPEKSLNTPLASALSYRVQKQIDGTPARRAYFGLKEGDDRGSALDSTTRSRFEARFGRSLGEVRIHTDAAASESARVLGAAAFTVGEHIFFGLHQFQPGTEAGERLLAHELTHAVQQMRAPPEGTPTDGLASGAAAEREVVVAGRVAFSATPIAATSTPRGVATSPASDVAVLVAEKEDLYDPEASGGIGDFPAAFRLLSPLDPDLLLDVLTELDKRSDLEPLLAHIGSAGPDRPRMELCAGAVSHVRHRLSDAELRGMGARLAGVEASVQAAIERFLSRFPRHMKELFLHGPDAELDRLARVKTDELAEAAKVEAEAENKRLEEQARNKGTPPPPAAKADIGQSLEKQVKSRALPALPTAPWDSLSDADKKRWNDDHYPRAVREIEASIKGTELEGVMKGKGWAFQPREVLLNGGYAMQDRDKLAFGMAFVKDVIDPADARKPATPRNVWPIIAHEMGGHFAYGPEYAGLIMDRVLQKLPEAERKRYADPELRRQLFSSFAYAETEIFAALRQRRYDRPLSGPIPAHGAMKADDNIRIRLDQIGSGFSREVGEAILVELRWKVEADNQILDRDKAFFAQELKKRGWSID